MQTLCTQRANLAQRSFMPKRCVCRLIDRFSQQRPLVALMQISCRVSRFCQSESIDDPLPLSWRAALASSVSFINTIEDQYRPVISSRPGVIQSEETERAHWPWRRSLETRLQSYSASAATTNNNSSLFTEMVGKNIRDERKKEANNLT